MYLWLRDWDLEGWELCKLPVAYAAVEVHIDPRAIGSVAA